MDKLLFLNDITDVRITKTLPGLIRSVFNVDPLIKKQLQELNTLLGKGCLKVNIEESELQTLLQTPLTPKFYPDREFLDPETAKKVSHDWDPDSLASVFHTSPESGNTLSDRIQKVPALSIIRSQFRQKLAGVLALLPTRDVNPRVILDTTYGALIDYLIACAFFIGERKDIDGLTDYILNDPNGLKNIANYAIVSAAREMIEKEQIKVPKYNEDTGDFVKALKAANILLSTAFQADANKIIEDFVFNAKEVKIIEVASKTIGEIPSELKPLLVQYIKNSPIKITNENATYFLPLFISQIMGATRISDTTEVDTEAADRDFEVTFPQDNQSAIQISKSAVKCAAQLYYAMILGDELDVFNVVNYFTHKYLIRGGIEIQDSHLRDDLQMYVFSNKFTDPKTKRILDRTRPSERQMFYRQVFNSGNARIMDDIILNREFTRLWKVLILESAKYIEREQESLKETYVPRQNVIQAVEDLQYNLSIHCTGMANVVTPLIYAELDFVIRNLFMHPEVLQQITPTHGTWWRVVETLYLGMKNSRPKTTVLYNKAKLGYEIINSIANYTDAASFSLDTTFKPFLGNVDAFITTQSILQEALTDDLRRDDDEETKQPDWVNNVVESVGAAASGAKAGMGEWDF